MFLYRNEQTASLRVDNGPLVTGASPGKLRQLNGNGQVYLGKFAHVCVLQIGKFVVKELMVG